MEQSDKAKRTIQILATVAVGLTVLTLVAWVLRGTIRRDRDRGLAKADLHSIRAALIRYKTRSGVYPATVPGLRVLVAPKKTSAPAPPIYRKYLPVTLLTDPWSNQYQYRCPAASGGKHSYEIWSLGKDGIDGTADDIRLSGP